MHRSTPTCVLLIHALLTTLATAAPFTPDPASIQREGPAYRYPQAGWIVVHVEGEPYDRGVQQGKLLWREIQDYTKCFAAQQSNKAPADAWKLTRTIADALFVRRFDPELLEEMKGIADGATAAGAKFDDRPIDLTDIVALNAWAEITSLDEALRAQPTGLEGKDFDKQSPRLPLAPRTSRCSAFAATGQATKNGKAIIGHITMFDLYPSNFFNVWLDVKPAKGHRLILQGGPGSVQSGMDWYQNDAGIVLTETTIFQTRFEPTGLSIGSRSRMAMQYGDSIESVVKILGARGNGLYSNEWILADMKTNEIALYELGTKASRLLRSSKNEWFGGTTGFYWGCNNTKDLSVRLETLAAANDRPADVTFVPEDRDKAWVQLYRKHRGSIGEEFGRLAFGKPPVAAHSSCDAKYTTTDMAMRLACFAHWGDPYDKLWEPAGDTRDKFPDARPIVPNDWTTLAIDPPPVTDLRPALAAVDLKGSDGGSAEPDSDDDKDKPQPVPAWHGTILPASDADLWLTSAFARFHDTISRERELLKTHQRERDRERGKARDGPVELNPAERDEIAVKLFRSRSEALSSAADWNKTALRNVKSDPSDDGWYRNASGRGVMLLAELRRRIGAEKFDPAMDAFGRKHAGHAVSTEDFVTALSALDGVDLKEFFARWIESTDALPTLKLEEVATEHVGDDDFITGRVTAPSGLPPASIDVTIETEEGETTATFPFDAQAAPFRMKSDGKPRRLLVNKYGQTPCTNGWTWSGAAFKRDLEHTIIIYGTRADAVGNRIAAQKLQQAIVDQWEHATVPIKADADTKEDDLRGAHLLLIGSPASSALIERLAGALPVSFGSHSFVARAKTYANADSAVIATGANPQDPRYSVVCVAGLSPTATLRAAIALPESAPTPLKVMPANRKAKDVVPAALDLVRDLK